MGTSPTNENYLYSNKDKEENGFKLQRRLQTSQPETKNSDPC